MSGHYRDDGPDPHMVDEANAAADLRAEVEELRACLAIAHIGALQGGYDLSDPDEKADANRVRRALGAFSIPVDS